MKENLKQILDNRLSNITISENIKNNIINNLSISQKNIKKRPNKFYLKPVLGVSFATLAIIILFPTLSDYFMNNDHKINIIGEGESSSTEEEQNLNQVFGNDFNIKVYAAEMDSSDVNETNLQSNKIYNITPSGSNIYNKFYNVTCRKDDLTGFGVVYYGFNLKIEGKDIKYICFTTDKGNFAQKVDADNNNYTRELFESSKEYEGIILKESIYEDITPKYCGDKSKILWLLKPVGNSYTVAYGDQGTANNLYALRIAVNNDIINEFAENMSENDSKFEPFAEELNGTNIKITVTYVDGTTKTKTITIHANNYWEMGIALSE